MTALRIDSNRDGAFAIIDQTLRADYFRAESRSGELVATVEFYEMNVRPVGVFFSELAATWRGWEGERGWGSPEGEVGLTATHEKFGTVVLSIELRSDVYVPATGYLWTATATLFLAAGGLDVLARQAMSLTA